MIGLERKQIEVHVVLISPSHPWNKGVRAYWNHHACLSVHLSFLSEQYFVNHKPFF